MKKNLFIVFAIVGLIVSCDKDYNTIGSDLIGDGNYDFDKYTVENIKAYSKATGSVQSNNLPVNLLGIYNNPFFGVTKASFVSQLELSNEGVSVGYLPEIDSVYLYVPYFYDASKTVTDDDGNREFVLDSVYGFNENAKFNLEVYENGFVLNDFNPNENYEENQKYYNDQAEVETFRENELLNNSIKTEQNTQFFIDDKEIKIYETDGNGVYVDENGDPLSDQIDESLRVVKTRKTPGIWLDLKNDFFQSKILDQAENGILFNNNVFKNHFKGLYFKVTENSPGVGSMASLDFSKAELKIIFKSTFTEPTPENPNPEKLRRELNFRMGYKESGPNKCNSINLLAYDNGPNYTSAILNMNNNELNANGDSRLFLKGGEGSVVYIDLFGNEDDVKLNEDGELVSGSNGVPDELDRLRSYKWLINEARLTFYIEQTIMANLIEPERIYVFDATNDSPIVDYYADPSTSSNAKFNKVAYGGIIERDNSTEKGIRYRVRLTEYINRVLNNDDPNLNQNIRLGVCVTESINLATNASLKNPFAIYSGSETISLIPVANVMSPVGTVLYGTNIPEDHPDFGNKLKLEIYYTKPN